VTIRRGSSRKKCIKFGGYAVELRLSVGMMTCDIIQSDTTRCRRFKVTHPDSGTPLTEVLRQLADGGISSQDDALVRLHRELRQIAAGALKGGRPSNTLQITTLVNETVLRVLQSGAKDWENRQHFFAFAACVMRRIVIDHARVRKHRGKARGHTRISFDEIVEPLEIGVDDLEALDFALTKLETFNPQGARLIELRFFLGLPMDAAAAAMRVSKRTAEREWTSARAWLHQELSRDA
jgi:RNA polymerase sigma factor (TIGR02999 family)